MKENKGKKPSIGLIIILMILFYPVGLYLIYKRKTYDKTDLNANYKANAAYGYLLISSAIIVNFLTVNQGADSAVLFVTLIIFFIPGMLLVRKAKKYKDLKKYYYLYQGLIANESVASIDFLAESTHTSPNKTIENLNKLIEYGLMNDGYINLGTRQIIFPSRKKINIFVTNNVVQKADSRQKVVICNGCGAKTSIYDGSVTKCDFCDSLLA